MSQSKSTLPAFAKLAAAVVHAPSLFQSLPKGQIQQQRTLNYQAGELQFQFVGPLLGALELRVLQGLAGLAGPQNHELIVGAKGDPAQEDQEPEVERITISTSYNELARVIGYRANSGSSNSVIRDALETLCSMSVFVGLADAPLSENRAVGTILNQQLDPKDGPSIVVEMCLVLTAAILGGRGQYLRVSLDEVRSLKTDPARLLHHRLHWVNQGCTRDVKISTMMNYVWPNSTESPSTLRTRRQVVRRALNELMGLGWTVFKKAGDLYSIGRPAVSRTARMPYHRHSPAILQTRIAGV